MNNRLALYNSDYYKRINVKLVKGGNCLTYYTNLPVEEHDIVMVETRYHQREARVVSVEQVSGNPFSDGRARAHVVRNVTQEKGYIMINCKYEVTIDRSPVGNKDSYLQVGYNSFLEPDTTVVYEAPSGAGIGMAVGRVVDCCCIANRTKEEPESNIYHWVVGVVDTSEYDAMVERERRTAELKLKLEEKRKTYEDLSIYRLLAEVDCEAKSLLDELTALTVGSQADEVTNLKALQHNLKDGNCIE